jgi:broad specificity phosphatase PhoE
MRKATAILALLITFCVSACDSQRSSPTHAHGSTIILVVRHAEKASDAEDSPLAEAGIQRAQALARVAEDAGVSAIYCSQLKRSIDTAKPLSDRLGVAVTQMPVNLNSPGDYGKSLAKEILAKHAGQTVLVVGHNNTLASTIEGLSGRAAPIDNVEYSDLYIVTIPPSGEAGVIKVQYGLKYGS